MKNTLRTMLAAAVCASAATITAPAFAQDEVVSDVEVSANVALVTDYRFRGVSLSDGEFAIQGGIDVAHASGFYVGTWASSLDEGPGDEFGSYGSTELDIYAGWSGALTDTLAVDAGILLYAYPDGDSCNCDYWEPYASITGAVGPAEVTAGVAYAWEQSSLGDQDNLYVYGDAGFGIPTTGISLSAHLGYTDGVLAPPLLGNAALGIASNDDTGFDWSVGASTGYKGLELGVAYIGTDGPSVNDFTDNAFVGSLSASF